MIACVGQQNVEGKRIPFGFHGRTLPHFTKVSLCFSLHLHLATRHSTSEAPSKPVEQPAAYLLSHSVAVTLLCVGGIQGLAACCLCPGLGLHQSKASKSSLPALRSTLRGALHQNPGMPSSRHWSPAAVHVHAPPRLPPSMSSLTIPVLRNA